MLERDEYQEHVAMNAFLRRRGRDPQALGRAELERAMARHNVVADVAEVERLLEDELEQVTLAQVEPLIADLAPVVRI